MRKFILLTISLLVISVAGVARTPSNFQDTKVPIKVEVSSGKMHQIHRKVFKKRVKVRKLKRKTIRAVRKVSRKTKRLIR